MEPEFWQQRWQENQIGFHQSEVNAHLIKHWKKLSIPAGSNVFVPLCGKSLDILWLRDQGYSVTGVEISPLAVEAFFQENNLVAEKQAIDDFTLHQSEGIDIYCGDYLKLSPRHLGDIRAVFDRASLIALPPSMRQSYVKHHVQLTDANIPVLLVTLEYPQDQMNGPPFSVSEEEVINLYAGRYEIEKLVDKDALVNEPRFAERGLTALHEKVYLLSS
jgi:thiopurine S-methyltransferase